jgi:hypothetical protein
MAFTLSSQARGWLSAGPDRFSSTGEVRGLRTVGAAVLALLRAEERGDVRRVDVDEALLHTLLSIDAPRADRVHVRARVAARDVSMREAAALLTTSRWPKSQNVCAVTRVESRAEGFFDVQPAEAFARVVSTYRVNWSNFMPYAPAVRAHFMSDPLAEQQAFLRAFLYLYDEDTDVTHQPGAAAAAAFLRERQRYLAWHTIVVDDVMPPVLPNPAACEAAFYEALAAYIDALTSTQQAVRDERDAFFQLGHHLQAVQETQLSSKKSAFAEVLAALLVPAPMVTMLAWASAVAALTSESLYLEYLPPSPPLVAATPVLTSTQATLCAAANAVLLSCC